MLDLIEGVLEEFAERSGSNYSWQKQTPRMKDSFIIARLSGRSTAPKEVVDDDGVVYPSVRAAATVWGLSPSQVSHAARIPARSDRKVNFRYLNGSY